MATNVDLATEKLMKTVHDETLQAFEGIKSTVEDILRASSEEVKKNFEGLLKQACTELEAIGKNGDKEKIKATVKQYTQTASDIEKEATRALNDTWNTTKSKLQTALEGAKSVLGQQSKELEKILKDTSNLIENKIGECNKIIHEFTKTILAQLNELNQQYLK